MGDASQHARLAPSGADRWTICPGSLAMEERSAKKEDTDYSAEGTAAHEVAAKALIRNNQCEAYVGYKASNGWEITQDMADDTQIYVDRIREYADGNQLLVEQKLPIEFITGEKDATGTSDAVIITNDLEELQVHDLKFGRGIKVDAEENKQLMMYALAALEQFGTIAEFKRVRLVIHQPRLHHLSEWDITVDGLREFFREARSAAETAFYLTERGGKEIEKHLNPGEKQCQWCAAKANCPALARFVSDTVGAEFLDLTITNEVSSLLPKDTELLADKMNAIGIIETWCKAVRAEVERTLLEGRHVPGYKIVQGKQGNRAWTDADIVEETLKKMRLKQEEMYSFTLISPTTAEKVFKTNPRQWKKLQEFITRSEGKLSVAPESDKRPAISLQPVDDDFADISQPGMEFV